MKEFIDENDMENRKVMEKKHEVGNNLSIFHCNLSDNMVKGHLRNTFWEESPKAWQNVAEKLQGAYKVVALFSISTSKCSWHINFLH